MVGKQLYASRVVNGPRKQRMTVRGALPGLRSMLNGPLFHVCHANDAMPSSLDSFCSPDSLGLRTRLRCARTCLL
jgi:hypothetical protein